MLATMQRTVQQSWEFSCLRNLLCTSQLSSRSGVRYSSYKAVSEWTSNPVSAWRSDGSLYKNRSAQAPSSGWGLRGPFLALVAGGAAWLYVQWPSNSPPSAVDLQNGINTVHTALQKALTFSSPAKKEPEHVPAAPASATTDNGPVEKLQLLHKDEWEASGDIPAFKTPDPELARAVHTAAAEQTEQVAGAGNNATEDESEPLNASDRLQETLSALSPLLQRANAALIGPSLESEEPAKVQVSSSMRAVEGSVRAASSLVQEQVVQLQGVPDLDEELAVSTLLARNPAAVGGAATVGAAARQAAADVEKFHDVMQQATNTHSKELTEAVQETAHWEAQAEEKVHAANTALRRAHRFLEAQVEMAERNKMAALQLQELNTAVNFETAANQDRTKRLKLIDDARMDVNAVHLAHSQAQDKMAEMANYNRQVSVVTQLCDALSKSIVVEDQLKVVREASPDEVVTAAVSSVPEVASTEGVSTVEQLQQKWPVIRRTLRVDSALSHEPKHGLISMCLAVASSTLKVPESVQSGEGEATLEARLAAADAAVASGDLVRTLEILDEVGTRFNVDPMVKKYIAAVKFRALIEQSSTLLRAHQAVLATAAF